MIPASTIQMTRGCVVMFTCFFSVVFLGRAQYAFHYWGVALVATGITIVRSSFAEDTLGSQSVWVEQFGSEDRGAQ